MHDDNITQFAAIFSAAGAVLHFDTRTATLEVVESGNQEIINRAVEEVSLYENTANYSDGLAAVFHADYIDNKDTPFTLEQREHVLTELGIKSGGKFIAQYLATQKTNRSWHTSEVPNKCSYFGDECTNRGIVEVPGKRGRKSTRKPGDFHRMSSMGTIAREQLVTKALDNLYHNIPSAKLISANNGNISLDRLKNLPDDKLHEILEAIEQIKSERT